MAEVLKAYNPETGKWEPVVPGAPGQSAYERALANGFEGTEAEWLDSLQGADGLGVPGREVELQTSDTAVQWRYEGDTEWIDLVPLTDITGPQGDKGDQGDAGREVELQSDGTYIQWRYVGDTDWINIVPLSSLVGPKGDQGDKGDAGDPGEDGREVEIQSDGTYIQWRYSGEAEWTNIVPLSSLVGPPGADGAAGSDGENGADGSDGVDGREVEFQASATHIQWRYVGDASWTDLIALTELTGPKGDKGDKGDPGEDGQGVPDASGEPDGRILITQGGVWVSGEAPASSSGLELSGQWTYSGTPGESAPGWGAMNADVTPASATVLYFNNHDANGLARAAFLQLVSEGMEVWAQSDTDPLAWVKYRVTGDASRTGDVVEIPVESYETGANAATGWTSVNVGVLSVGGGEITGSGINARGEWNSDLLYHEGDSVRIGNQSYVAIADNQGISPQAEATLSPLSDLADDPTGDVPTSPYAYVYVQTFEVTEEARIAGLRYWPAIRELAKASIAVHEPNNRYPQYETLAESVGGPWDDDGAFEPYAIPLDSSVTLVPGVVYAVMFQSIAVSGYYDRARLISPGDQNRDLIVPVGEEGCPGGLRRFANDVGTESKESTTSSLFFGLMTDDASWDHLSGLPVGTMETPAPDELASTQAVADAIDAVPTLDALGEWSAGTTYSPGNSVRVGNESFLASEETTGQDPTDRDSMEIATDTGPVSGNYSSLDAMVIGTRFTPTEDITIDGVSLDPTVSGNPVPVEEFKVVEYASGVSYDNLPALAVGSAADVGTGSLSVLDGPVTLQAGTTYAILAVRAAKSYISVGTVNAANNQSPILTLVSILYSGSRTGAVSTLGSNLGFQIVLHRRLTPWAKLSGLPAVTDLDSPDDVSLPTSKAVSDAIDASAESYVGPEEPVGGQPFWFDTDEEPVEPDASSGVNPRGAWSPGLSYARGDVVSVGNESYMAESEIPSGSGSPEGQVVQFNLFDTFNPPTGSGSNFSYSLNGVVPFVVSREVRLSAISLAGASNRTAIKVLVSDVEYEETKPYSAYEAGAMASGYLESDGVLYFDSGVVLSPGTEYVVGFVVPSGGSYNRYQEPPTGAVVQRSGGLRFVSGVNTSLAMNDGGEYIPVFWFYETPSPGDWAHLSGLPAVTDLDSSDDESIPTSLAVKNYVDNLDADDIDDSATAHKFATQAQLDKIAENDSAIEDIEQALDTSSASAGDLVVADGSGSVETQSKEDLDIASASSLGTMAAVTPGGTPSGSKFLRDDNTWAEIPEPERADAQTYTPVLSAPTPPNMGTGSTLLQYGKWWRNGDGTVTVVVSLRFGQTDVSAGSGGYTVSLPTPAHADHRAGSTPVSGDIIGSGHLRDNSNRLNSRPCIINLGDDNTHVRINAQGGYVDVTDALPWTWTNGDGIAFTATYREADPPPLTLGAPSSQHEAEVTNAVNEWWVSPMANYRTDKYDRTSFGAIDTSGNILACEFNHGTGRTKRYVVGSAPSDDHNTPALLDIEGLPTVITWTHHGMDNLLKVKVGNLRGDLGALVPGSPVTKNVGGPVSYTQLHYIEGLSDETTAIVWCFCRRSSTWVYVPLVITRATGAVHIGTPTPVVHDTEGRLIYLSTADAHTPEGSNQVIRAAWGFNPAEDSKAVRYIEIDTVTGIVTSPFTPSLSHTLGAYAVLDTDVDPMLTEPAAGQSRRLFYVRPGPDAPAVAVADWTIGSEDDATYNVHELEIVEGSPTIETSSFGTSGPRFGHTAAANYVAGMAFEDPSRDRNVLVARSEGGNEYLLKYRPDGSGGFFSETLAETPTSDGRLVRPYFPVGGPSPYQALATLLIDYSPTGYLYYSGNVVAY